MEKIDLENFIADAAKTQESSMPDIFDLAQEADRARLAQLVEAKLVLHVSDDFTEQEKEYFGVANPSLVYQPGFGDKFQAYLAEEEKKQPMWQRGRWVYFPWLSSVSHILEDERFQMVRTARNKNLITQEEQDKFYHSVIGIAGLSVGNSVMLAIVLQGGGRHIKLADHDQLALSNTNRIRVGVENLGLDKVEMTARQIYAINPYVTIELFKDGLNRENMSDFFDGGAKLDIVIDEIDNLAVKYLIREHARANKIAVVMAADNGDNGVVDIERYDLDPETPFFHGRMGEVSYEMLSGLDKFGIGKMITKLVGAENVTIRMQESLLEMGKTIVSWPQLGGAALLNGSAAAYCVRKILNGQPIENDRALVSLDELLIPTWNTPEEIAKRTAAAQAFKKIFNLE